MHYFLRLHHICLLILLPLGLPPRRQWAMFYQFSSRSIWCGKNLYIAWCADSGVRYFTCKLAPWDAQNAAEILTFREIASQREETPSNLYILHAIDPYLNIEFTRLSTGSIITMKHYQRRDASNCQNRHIYTGNVVVEQSSRGHLTDIIRESSVLLYNDARTRRHSLGD